jgi:hypothetical protein
LQEVSRQQLREAAAASAAAAGQQEGEAVDLTAADSDEDGARGSAKRARSEQGAVSTASAPGATAPGASASAAGEECPLCEPGSGA